MTEYTQIPNNLPTADLNKIPNYCVIKRKKKFNDVKIMNPKDATDILKKQVKSDREIFSAIYLDTKNNVLDVTSENVGGRNQSLASPENIFRGALMRNANSIIVTHNHPSGDPTPSNEDRQVCEVLKKGGKIININVLDCLVVGKKGYVSLNDEI